MGLITQTALAAGDVNAGKQLARQGNGQGATACIACHGANGEGNAATGFPRLAGLNADYLAKQLHDYQSGSRQNPVMQPFAKAMSDSEIRNVAAYYASLDPKTGASRSATNQTGQELAMRGDWDATIPACISCHGPGGRGIEPEFPALAGQHASYITSQLQAWRNGKRHNDENDLMKVVAERLDSNQINAVAEYFANLSPVKNDSGNE
ncbi:MAG: c-type cytochrome [Pseudomonadota bacterium]|nr:c-type cytochrome [Pseudomonadota bacterium]